MGTFDGENASQAAKVEQYRLQAEALARGKAESEAALLRPTINSSAPIYDPYLWMTAVDTNQVNCYEYVVAGRHNLNAPGIAHPGETKFIYNIFDSDRGISRFTPAVLHRFAEADGLVFAGTTPPPPREGYYVVASYLATYDHNPSLTRDYHWIRQDADGRWSHKFGKEPVSLVRGADGNPVTDAPDKIHDYQRTGFFYVRADGLDVGYSEQLRQIKAGTYTPAEIPPEAHNVAGITRMPAGATVAETLNTILDSHSETTWNQRSILRYFNDIACQDTELGDLNAQSPDKLKSFIKSPGQCHER